MHKRLAVVAACVALAACCSRQPVLARPADDTPDRPAPVDAAIEPTHRGGVAGQVYDAVTGRPLEGATVAVQSGGLFDTSGPGVARTDSAGRYECKALIGRTSANFDVGRAVFSNPVAVLLGAATNRTKRVDVSRVALRVVCPGHQPFEGVVECRDVQAGRFRVLMAPILLTPDGSAEVSTAAPGWGIARIADITVTPPVARSGEKMVVTARVESPALARARDMKLEYNCLLGNEVKRGSMRLQKEPQGGFLVFTADIRAPKTRKPVVGDVEVHISESPYDVAAGGALKAAVIQVTADGSSEPVVEKRAEAFRTLQQGDGARASAQWKELCSADGATRWDYVQLERISRQLNDTRSAAEAAGRVYELTPDRPEDRRLAAAAGHAQALVADGAGAEAIRLYGKVVSDVKPVDRPAKLPLALMVALASAHTQAGELVRAEAISQELLKWPGADLYAGTGEMRNDLRLATARQRLDAQPTVPAARVDYARVLMDLGRWEEAIDHLQTAAAADPALPTVRRDLHYAMLHVQGGEKPDPAGVADALEAAQRQVYVTDAKGRHVKSKDFFAWHSLGMLLYVRARDQADAGDPSAQATLGRCREALREALRCGRRGADVNEGVFLGSLGYATGRSVTIAGFAYSEADSDFVMLDSLRTLERDPDNYLAHFSLAQALFDLGQSGLAEAPLRRALALRPAFTDGMYLEALVASRTGRRADAVTSLQAVLAVNPRHPQANLTLARIYTEDGDMSAAAARIAAHAKYYAADTQ